MLLVCCSLDDVDVFGWWLFHTLAGFVHIPFWHVQHKLLSVITMCTFCFEQPMYQFNTKVSRSMAPTLAQLQHGTSELDCNYLMLRVCLSMWSTIAGVYIKQDKNAGTTLSFPPLSIFFSRISIGLDRISTNTYQVIILHIILGRSIMIMWSRQEPCAY